MHKTTKRDKCLKIRPPDETGVYAASVSRVWQSVEKRPVCRVHLSTILLTISIKNCKLEGILSLSSTVCHIGLDFIMVFSKLPICLYQTETLNLYMMTEMFRR